MLAESIPINVPLCCSFFLRVEPFSWQVLDEAINYQSWISVSSSMNRSNKEGSDRSVHLCSPFIIFWDRPLWRTPAACQWGRLLAIMIKSVGIDGQIIGFLLKLKGLATEGRLRRTNFVRFLLLVLYGWLWCCSVKSISWLNLKKKKVRKPVALKLSNKHNA